MVSGWHRSTLRRRALTVTHRVDPLVTAFLASLARYGVLAVVGISVLQLFGIQTASLVAVLGATSLAIGLALQGTLSNLAAGVMLLLFRPFSVGDEVELAGKAGKVRSLSLFMTELVAPDNTQILLPNASVWGTAIINHSAYPGTGEFKVSFPVQAGAAETVGREILDDLRNDPETGPKRRAGGACLAGDGDLRSRSRSPDWRGARFRAAARCQAFRRRRSRSILP